MSKRRKIPVDIQRLVLHEAGYKCANPACRTILTLELHHIQPVSKEGPNTAENLLALCANCHEQHNKKIITDESIRSWKFLLLALNEAYDRKSVDLLLALHKCGLIWTSGDALYYYAPLIAADMVSFKQIVRPQYPRYSHVCQVGLTKKGKAFVEGWKNGDQEAAIYLQVNDK